MAQQSTINTKEYIPDEKDKVLLRKWIISSLCKKFGRARLYLTHLKVLLGLIQDWMYIIGLKE